MALAAASFVASVPAVLPLLDAPALRHPLEGGIVMEHAAEVLRVVGAVLLDQARRLDDAQEIGLDPGGVEAIPGDILERPRSHDAAYPPLGPPVELYRPPRAGSKPRALANFSGNFADRANPPPREFTNRKDIQPRLWP